MLKNIKRIVPGKGGDSTLIIGSEKTAVIDTAMDYCGERLADLLEKELSGRDLDYVFLTHSHYDHAGGVPALRGRWPELTVFGSRHAQDILVRKGARRTIRELAEMAGNQYLDKGGAVDLEDSHEQYKPDYRDEELRVDSVVRDGDVISLGDHFVSVLETLGHTNCSLSYLVTERGSDGTAPLESVMFPSESIGCYQDANTMEVPFLTGFQVTIDSIEKCRACRPDHIISPHFGLVAELDFDEYFDLAAREVYATRDYILERSREGLSEEAILERCIDHFWISRGEQRDEQPLPAFVINMKATIRVVMREFA